MIAFLAWLVLMNTPHIQGWELAQNQSLLNFCTVECKNGKMHSDCSNMANEGEPCGRNDNFGEWPIDVPAVRKLTSDFKCHCPDGAVCGCIAVESDYLWTCADKSRILLTAEDGKRWCHKVQP